jgi:UDP-2,3-diacylglucosamine hydrolase
VDAPLHELTAPPAWRCIEFISDLHLAEDTPRGLEAWREYLLGTRADAIFILGDLFEAWVGDDARFEGFEAGATAVLREAAARRPIGFMVGNRDFLLGAEMLADCGVRALSDPTVLAAFGQRTLLAHGDAWCIADTEYQQFRRMVRNPAWQAQVLGLPLAERRARARSMRSESERKAAEHQGGYADVDHPIAIAQLNAARATTLVHGHTHRPATETLAPGLVRHVLSDWDLDHAEHAARAPRAEVLRWRDGAWTRLAPADTAR